MAFAQLTYRESLVGISKPVCWPTRRSCTAWRFRAPVKPFDHWPTLNEALQLAASGKSWLMLLDADPACAQTRILQRQLRCRSDQYFGLLVALDATTTDLPVAVSMGPFRTN